jgi:hypothetical protein
MQTKRAEDAIDAAWEMPRFQNEWLLANRSAVDARIRQDIPPMDRGEGIPEADLDAHLTRWKAERE